MFDPNSRDSTPRLLGVLAGNDAPLYQIESWAKSADIVLAADGAYDLLKTASIEPAMTIGDMDSVSADSGRNLIVDRDQNSSDCDKLLAYAASLGHREITLVNVEGDRVDHVLGTFASAARSNLSVRLVLRKGMAWVLNGPAKHDLTANPGDVVSLMPLERCEVESFEGVRWELRNRTLTASGLVSLSNEAAAPHVHTSILSGSAVLFHLPDRPVEPYW